jgi:hypothetical protein
MQTLADGRVWVFTFKRGLLSKVAHDLRLSLERFEVETDGERVQGRFFVDSLSVVGAVRDGAIDASALSESDKQEIANTIRTEILHTDRHPEVVFEGRAQKTPEGFRVRGVLELVGRREEIEIAVRRRGDRLEGEVELAPSRYGIEPFKALLGAIKLADRVIIRFEFAEPE